MQGAGKSHSKAVVQPQHLSVVSREKRRDVKGRIKKRVRIVFEKKKAIQLIFFSKRWSTAAGFCGVLCLELEPLLFPALMSCLCLLFCLSRICSLCPPSGTVPRHLKMPACSPLLPSPGASSRAPRSEEGKDG